MPVPAFLLFLMIVLIPFLALCFFYFRIYKRRINEALVNASGRGKTLPAPFSIAATLLVVFLLLAVILSFFAGLRSGYQILEKQMDEGQIDVHAFYAEVKEIGNHAITVSGIQANDEKYQGEFTYRLYDGLMIEYHEQAISIDDITEGDYVEIILLTAVNGYEDIFKIQLIRPHDQRFRQKQE